MDLPEMQRAGLTGCMRDSINHLPAAGQGNQLGGMAMGVWRRQHHSQNRTAAVHGSAKHSGGRQLGGQWCAPDHRAGQVMGITWVTQLAKVL